jgi:GntR family transcriptional regulator
MPGLVTPRPHAALYDRLAGQGHRAVRFMEEIEVRRATQAEAGFLGLAEGLPVFEVVRVAYDQDARAIDVAVNVLSSYQWHLVYEWDDANPPRKDTIS